MRTGVFTTIRIEQGQLWHDAWHRKRLLHDASRIEQRLPVLAAYVRTHIDEAFHEAALAASGQSGSGQQMARLVFETDGQIPMHRAEVRGARRQPWQPTAKPLALLLRPDPRPADELRVKWLERRCFSQVEAEAVRGGADGVVLHGPHSVHEGTWFHIAARVEGDWCSPAAGTEVIYGATRAAFFHGARGVGLTCHEDALPMEKLARADAVFALSSLLGVAPVARIGELRFDASFSCWEQQTWAHRL